jgi:hypothetical protein
MAELASPVQPEGAMHDRDLGIIDVASPYEVGSCWCGEPTDDEDVGALGLSFCVACRARMVRSCASILAIARSRAARAAHARRAGRSSR